MIQAIHLFLQRFPFSVFQGSLKEGQIQLGQFLELFGKIKVPVRLPLQKAFPDFFRHFQDPSAGLVGRARSVRGRRSACPGDLRRVCGSLPFWICTGVPGIFPLLFDGPGKLLEQYLATFSFGLLSGELKVLFCMGSWPGGCAGCFYL